MTYKYKQVDIGDKCIECLRSTAFGTGLYVNRISADNDKYFQNVIGMSVIGVMKKFTVMKIALLMTFLEI